MYTYSKWGEEEEKRKKNYIFKFEYRVIITYRSCLITHEIIRCNVVLDAIVCHSTSINY